MSPPLSLFIERSRQWGTGAALFFLGSLIGAQAAAAVAVVVTPRTVGSPVAQLERQIGRPMQTNGDERHYLFQGCPLDVVVRQGKVARLEMPLSDLCRPNWVALLPPNTPVPTFPLTFGQLDAAIPGLHYEADCLEDCGDPRQAYLFAGAPMHPGTRTTLVLFVAHTEIPATFQAGQAWRQAMVAHMDDVYVMSGTFNCESAQDRLAAPCLRDVAVQEVWVSQATLTPWQCP
jgi:hypothetical protein